MTSEIAREWILSDIVAWLEQNTGSPHFLLVAEPGAGKSTIATQLSTHQSLIHAYHFCSSRNIRSIDPIHFSRSLAQQLLALPGFSQTLSSDPKIDITAAPNVTTNLGTVIGVNIETLVLNATSAIEAFSRAIADPLRRLYEQGRSDRLVLLIDGLDEALQYQGAETIVDLVARDWGLGPDVRFVLTSRPHDTVLSALEAIGATIYRLADYPNQVASDIQQCIAQFFDSSPLAFPHKWLGSAADLADQLAILSGSNFLVLIRLLDGLLDQSGLAFVADNRNSLLPIGIEQIYYHDFVTRKLNRDPRQWRQSVRPVLSALVVAQEAMSRKAIIECTGIDQQSTVDVLRDLRHLLDPSEYDQGKFLLFHNSVAEFLADEKSAKEFWIDKEAAQTAIAVQYAQTAIDWYECDLYRLKYAVHHFLEAGLHGSIATMLGAPQYLDARANRSDTRLLLHDFERCQPLNSILNDIYEALRANSQRLLERPALTLQQVFGYLRGKAATHTDEWVNHAELIYEASPFRPPVWLRRDNRCLDRTTREAVRIHHTPYETVVTMQVLDDSRVAIYSTNGDRAHDEPTDWISTHYSGEAAERGALEILNVRTGACLKRYYLKNSRCLAISSDRERYLVAFEGREVSLCALETGREIRSFACGADVSAVAFSADDRYVALGFTNGDAALWALDGTYPQYQASGVFGHAIRHLVFSDDGKTIATVSRSTLKLLDGAGLTELCHMTGEDTIDTVIYDKQQQRFLFSDTEMDINYVSRIRSIERDGRHDSFALLNYRVLALAISGNGAFVVAGTNRGKIGLWQQSEAGGKIDLERRSRVSQSNTKSVAKIGFLRDHETFVTADEEGQIWFWRTSDFPDAAARYQAPILNATFYGDASVLTYGGDGKVRIWNVDDGHERAGEQQITSRRSTAGAVTATFPKKRTLVLTDRSKAEHYSSEVNVAILNPQSMGAVLIDPITDKIEYVNKRRDQVFSAAIANDQQTLALGSRSAIEIWRAGEVAMQLEGQNAPPTALAFSDAGDHLLAGGGFANRTALELWDLKKKTCITSRPLVGEARYLKFTPRGDYIVGVVNGNPCLWDASLYTVAEQTDGTILCAALSPTGEYLATGGEDGSIRLWSVDGMQEVAVFTGPRAICGIEFDNIGTAVLACNAWPEPTIYRLRIMI